MARKGFKAWCERTAGQYRKSFEIEETSPLCAWNLAAHLGVVVKTPKQIPGLSPDDLDILLGEEGLNKKETWLLGIFIIWNLFVFAPGWYEVFFK